MDDFDSATRHNVRAIHKNSQWDHETLQFDFALLELEEPIALGGPSSWARAVCLPGPEDTDFSTSTRFVVSGWGRMGEKANAPTKLHMVTLPWVSHFQCQLDYFRVSGAEIGPTNICAGGTYDGGKDACYGDSGGTDKKKLSSLFC